MAEGASIDNPRVNVGFFKTPVIKRRKSTHIPLKQRGNEDGVHTSYNDEVEGEECLTMTTPMALKTISNRAQKELAMLYSPCTEEEPEN